MRMQGTIRTLLQLLSDSEVVLLGWTACEKLHKTQPRKTSLSRGVQMSRLNGVAFRVDNHYHT